MNEAVLFFLLTLTLCIGYAIGAVSSKNSVDIVIRRMVYRATQLLSALAEESDLNGKTKRAIDKCYEAMDDYFDNID